MLSATVPTAVILTLSGLDHLASVHHMVPVVDQRSGETHSQVYSVSLPTPQDDFSWRVTAKLGEENNELCTPLVGNQSVVVV